MREMVCLRPEPYREIYRVSDSFGDILVLEGRNKRVMTFDSIYEQSSMLIDSPHLLSHEYTKVMMLIVALIKPEHVTLLGLGGGSLLRSMHWLLPDTAFQVVELRPAVIDVASEFFAIPQSQRVAVLQDDAKDFLRQAKPKSTDLILADMYHSSGMNILQQQKRFVTSCERLLTQAGWLVINFHRMPDFKSPFFRWLCERFADVRMCSTSTGNTILFAGKKASELSDAQLAENLQQLGEQLEEPFVHYFKRLIRLQV